MLLEYITENYQQGEPIFLEDIKISGISNSYIRQGMKKLVNSGEILRYDQGIYYRPISSRLKGNTTLAPDIVARHKYVSRKGSIIGYYSGYTFANKVGLSAQVPVKEEIVSNNMAAIVREVDVGGKLFVVRKAPITVNSENYLVLQLLDLLKNLNAYCDDEVSARDVLEKYIKDFDITRDLMDKYIIYYPIRVYKTIYDMRLDYVFA